MREHLDNLTFVVNANRQRLDGPARQQPDRRRAEGVFAGAGWHVVKVPWGSQWERLFAARAGAQLLARLDGKYDGHLQRPAIIGPAEPQRELFGDDPAPVAIDGSLTSARSTCRGCPRGRTSCARTNALLEKGAQSAPPT